jgi:hypothetical protein
MSLAMSSSLEATEVRHSSHAHAHGDGGPASDVAASAVVARGTGSPPAAADGSTSPIGTLPAELLVLVLAEVDTRTLLLVVPGVCRRWRDACPLVAGVVLDLTFLPEHAALRTERNGSATVRWLSSIFTRFPQVSECTSV